MKRQYLHQGFTLMEVLVVLAILVTSFAALSQLQTSALKEAAEVEEKTSVQTLCQNELEKILAGITEIVPFQQMAIADFDGWIMTIRLEDVPFPNLTRIRITAQKCEILHTPSGRPGVFDIIQKPIAEVTVAQWTNPNRIRIAGRIPSADRDTKTGQEHARSAAVYHGEMIGSLSAPPTVDPFASIDQMNRIGSLSAQPDPFASSGFSNGPSPIGKGTEQ